MVKGLAVFSMLAVAAAIAAGCTVHDAASPPSPTGPSQFAMQVNMTANPDRISLDGGSQSLITVQVRGPNGQVQVNVPLRVDMVVNGSVQDYGKLNARNIVTGSDGNAFAVYTAPALAAGANQPIATVSIRAIIVGGDAAGAATHTVDISLVPSGVILPPADTPTASFVVTPTPVSLNVSASFDASASCPGAKNATGCLPSSSALITNYSWSFGDGATSSGKTVNHTFSSAGTFNVSLTITNDRGVMASTTQPILVGTTTAPTAAFVFSPTAPGINQTVNFNAAASAAAAGRTIAGYSWNFGDGATGGGVTSAHAFAATGTYNVTLTVRDDLGQSATANQTVTVSSVAGGSPTAVFTFSPTTPGVNQNVNFNASASTAGPGHTIASYSWNFGDGGTAALVTTTHAFAAAGTYVVTLTVTDDIGQKGTITQNVNVSAGPGALPTAAFTFSPAQPGVGENVFFNASTSTAGPGHTITTYSWTFGDSTTGVGVTPTHAYATAGTYSVQLKVTDDIGQTALSTVQQITPGNPPAPTANFTFSPAAPGRNDQVVFDASSSTTAQGQTIVDVAWNFGDATPVIHCPGGSPADCPGPTNRISAHTFATAQTFVVNLVVTDSAGRTGSHNVSVTVALAQPNVIITTSPSSPNPGVTVFFNSNGTTYYPGSGPGAAPINGFSWTFGDGGSCSTLAPAGCGVGTPANPSHIYGSVGAYGVGLSVTDNKGRTGTGNATVTVVAVTPPPPPAPPVAAFTFSPASPSFAAPPVFFDGSTSTTPSGAAINNYRWNFGDGTIISGPPANPAPAPGGTFQAPRHTYAAQGSFTVTLTVTDTNSLSGSTTGTVTVGP
jgi:PKD repeat protein